ncbi:MAG: cell division protein FtsL [Gammaproteobacteria bacterium]|nr:cell division protein FtsL [Gammaproteobacteria bacterium]
MTSQQRLFLIATIVFMAVLASAILLVYSKHQSRKLFVELQGLKAQVDEFNTEWGQLQLEQSAWSGHGRIEQVARERLSMVMPDAEQVVFIRP